MRVVPNVILLLCASTSFADEPPRPPETSLAQRVTQLEERVARLERQASQPGLITGFQAVKGNWQVRDNEILSPKDPVAILQLPGKPPEEFVLSMQVRRLAGHNTFAVQLPVSGRPVLVAFDAHAGIISGLEYLDGKFVHENEATFRGTLFSQDVDTPVSITVRKDQITGAVADQKVIDWKGDVSRLTLPENLAGPDNAALHVVTLDCQYAISRITVVPLKP